MTGGHHIYDLAVSFAAEQRPYVECVVRACEACGLRVFYDRNKTVDFWGRNFIREFRAIYGGTQVRYFVPFLSSDYLTRPYPMDEFNAAILQALERSDDDYILPVMMGSVQVPANLQFTESGHRFSPGRGSLSRRSCRDHRPEGSSRAATVPRASGRRRSRGGSPTGPAAADRSGQLQFI